MPHKHTWISVMLAFTYRNYDAPSKYLHLLIRTNVISHIIIIFVISLVEFNGNDKLHPLSTFNL